MHPTQAPTGTGQPANICRYFASTGNCFYGDQCNFAHVLAPGTAAAQANAQSHLPKSQRPCRNVAIHGYCKFAGKGCEYSHEGVTKDSLAKDGAWTSSSPPSSTSAAGGGFSSLHGMPVAVAVGSVPPAASAAAAAAPVPMPVASLQYLPPNMTSLPHIQRVMTPGRRSLASFFVSETLRQDLVRRQALIAARLDPEDPRLRELPQSIGKYHTLYPLDEPSREKGPKLFGVPSSIYKATSSVDGLPYILRRLEGVRLVEQAVELSESWIRHVRHSGVVAMREVFMSKDWAEVPSVYVVYDFHPGAVTLEAKFLHVVPAAGSSQALPEQILWSILVQLAAALKSIHAAGLACRTLHPSKVLLTGKARVRLGASGVFDVLHPDPKGLQQHQLEDLLALGRLMLSLACRSSSAVQNVIKSVEMLGAHYSAEFMNVIMFLLHQPTSIDELCVMLAPRTMIEMEHLHQQSDILEAELSKEIENGRLFRLMVKLGFINERPEFDMDPSWSETGDRYILKLFRDYVFHQVHEDGSPALDFGHVLDSLNKLDVGVPEKVVLMSRDEQSMMVASYADLKRCVEAAFNELQRQAKPI